MVRDCLESRKFVFRKPKEENKDDRQKPRAQARFAPQLIATEEEKILKFQDGLKPYLKNKIPILKLSVYSEVVDRALIVDKDNEELH